jgi:hypothetical protein
VTALSRSLRYVTCPLRTLSPLAGRLIAQKTGPFDLHVLATPPAFVLSQDQTLQFDSSIHRGLRPNGGRLIKPRPKPRFGSTLSGFEHNESADCPEPHWVRGYSAQNPMVLSYALSLLYLPRTKNWFETLAQLLTCKRTNLILDT